MPTNYASIILAAGESIRMGFPKWQLRTSDGNYLYELLCKNYDSSGYETILVVNKTDYSFFVTKFKSSKIKIALNDDTSNGRFYSLVCGIKKLSETKSCILHNVDNPYYSKDLLKKLEKLIHNNEIVIPQYQGTGGHPCLISQKVINDIIIQKQPYPKINDFFKNYKIKRFDYNIPDILFNLNTPSVYSDFLKKHP